MMGLSTPVSDDGSTTWSGTSTRLPARSLYQCTRHRLRASGAFLSASPTSSAGNDDGSASWAKVGSVMPRSRKRATLLAIDGVVDHSIGQPELVLEGVGDGVGGGGRPGRASSCLTFCQTHGLFAPIGRANSL
jgi:hypothetical protein